MTTKTVYIAFNEQTVQNSHPKFLYTRLFLQQLEEWREKFRSLDVTWRNTQRVNISSWNKITSTFTTTLQALT